jgi:hypothetical protein
MDDINVEAFWDQGYLMHVPNSADTVSLSATKYQLATARPELR